MVELALLIPWYAFLFVGAYDYGFYAYGLIATQSAARIAAMYCSGNSSLASNCSSSACTYALDQLQNMPNVGTSLHTCTASPVDVTTSVVSGPDSASAAQVTVQYTTPQLIPIPGLLPNSLTISRTVLMRVAS
jgi:hypothetical protein